MFKLNQERMLGKVYHIIRRGKQAEVSSQRLDQLLESGEEFVCDIEWYMSYGCVTLDEIKKKHQM